MLHVGLLHPWLAVGPLLKAWLEALLQRTGHAMPRLSPHLLLRALMRRQHVLVRLPLQSRGAVWQRLPIVHHLPMHSQSLPGQGLRLLRLDEGRRRPLASRQLLLLLLLLQVLVVLVRLLDRPNLTHQGLCLRLTRNRPPTPARLTLAMPMSLTLISLNGLLRPKRAVRGLRRLVMRHALHSLLQALLNAAVAARLHAAVAAQLHARLHAAVAARLHAAVAAAVAALLHARLQAQRHPLDLALGRAHPGPLDLARGLGHPGGFDTLVQRLPLLSQLRMYQPLRLGAVQIRLLLRSLSLRQPLQHRRRIMIRQCPPMRGSHALSRQPRWRWRSRTTARRCHARRLDARKLLGNRAQARSVRSQGSRARHRAAQDTAAIWTACRRHGRRLHRRACAPEQREGS